MTTEEQVTGAVLAGGHSSRFGSNKALYAPDGKVTWLARGVRLLQSVCKRVLVSASRETSGVYANEIPGIEIVTDVYPDQGPLGGIFSLLRACSSPWLLILPCDMPFVDMDVLKQMLAQAQ